MLESVKESGYVSKCNPTGEFSLKSIKMNFNPVHQSSPPVQSSDCRLPYFNMISVKYVLLHRYSITKNDIIIHVCNNAYAILHNQFNVFTESRHCDSM